MLLFHTADLSVVSITDNDIPTLLEVYEQSEDFLALGPVAKASTQMVLEDIEGSRARHGQFCAITNNEGVTIGVLDFIPDSGEAKGSCYLSLLMIAAPWRNKGYGRAIVAALEAHQQSTAGTTHMDAAVQTNNGDAIQFWKKQGYTLSDESQQQSDGTITYELTKVLPGI